MSKRKTKAEWEREVRMLEGAIERLMVVGGMSNNACYNLSQCKGARLTERDCASLTASYLAWDQECARTRRVLRREADTEVTP